MTGKLLGAVGITLFAMVPIAQLRKKLLPLHRRLPTPGRPPTPD
tara:strand:+ start:101 stop:232 length:132 start_codon:yes stop_codon:yes gene_type:complete